MTETLPVLRVAVPSPLRQSFDYLPPPDWNGRPLRAGCRVQVPFGRTAVVGVLLEVTAVGRIGPERIKAALAILDDEPLWPADCLRLMLWAAAYYHHPVGDVVLGVLPGPLRTGVVPDAMPATVAAWTISAAGRALAPDQLTRAPRLRALLRLLDDSEHGVSAAAIAAGGWRAAVRTLVDRGWATACLVPGVRVRAAAAPVSIELSDGQCEAVAAVTAKLDSFSAFLLDGVTGSGKTEVYLRLIDQVVRADRQALVLVPEIGLTPQLVRRFEQRFQVAVAVLHSGLTDRQRMLAWLLARSGDAPIVLGTRSAVFTPLLRLGIIIIDEEHDMSFKQQDGFRYHARDVAVQRASHAGIPVLLGSATPSLETLHNVAQGRYRRLVLAERAGKALPVVARLVDIRDTSAAGALSPPLVQCMERHLARGEQVLLFLNRRGYAPTLTCGDCAWVAGCARCDARMVSHQLSGARLRCHHCGAARRAEVVCPACQSTRLRLLGQGTERVEEALTQRFPGVGIARVDRDSTRRKGALQALLDGFEARRSQILLGTQMLAKGHHLPQVTLVAILDADQGLFGVDFRAAERMAQLVVQVTGRAGRGNQPGLALIQTRYPGHPLLQLLLAQDYAAFAVTALTERAAAELPPYTFLALLRAEAASAAAPQQFLAEAQQLGHGAVRNSVQLLGPVPAPMERRAGRYRAQLLVQAGRRAELQRFIDGWLPQVEKLKSARKVRWSLDVDPVELV